MLKNKDTISSIKESGELKSDEEILSELLTFEEEDKRLQERKYTELMRTSNYWLLVTVLFSAIGMLVQSYILTVLGFSIVILLMFLFIYIDNKRKKYDLTILKVICVMTSIGVIIVETINKFNLY